MVVDISCVAHRGQYRGAVDGVTYSRWCGDAGIHWTHGRAACL